MAVLPALSVIALESWLSGLLESQVLGYSGSSKA